MSITQNNDTVYDRQYIYTQLKREENLPRVGVCCESEVAMNVIHPSSTPKLSWMLYACLFLWMCMWVKVLSMWLSEVGDLPTIWSQLGLLWLVLLLNKHAWWEWLLPKLGLHVPAWDFTSSWECNTVPYLTEFERKVSLNNKTPSLHFSLLLSLVLIPNWLGYDNCCLSDAPLSVATQTVFSR